MSNYKWPGKIFFIIVFALVAHDIWFGISPAKTLFSVTGFLFALLVAPVGFRFDKIKSTVWSLSWFLWLFLFATFFAVNMAIGTLLEQSSGKNAGTFYYGVCMGIYYAFVCRPVIEETRRVEQANLTLRREKRSN